MKKKAIISQVGVMLFTMVKGFVALKIMVQFGDHDYALLSQYFVVSMFGVQLIALNFDAALVSSLVNHPQDHRDVFNSLVHLMFFNLLIIALLAVLFPGVVSTWIWGGDYFIMLGLFLVYVLVLSGNQITLLCFQAERNFTSYSRLQMMQQLFQLFAIGLGLLCRDVTLVAIFAILFELALWVVGWKHKNCVSFSRQQFRRSKVWIRTNWPVAWPLFLGFFMIWGINNYGRFLVVNQLDLKILASYAATFSISILAGILINPICSVFFPYMSEKNGADSNAARSLLLGLTLLLLLTSCLGFTLTASTWYLMRLVARADLFAGFAFVACVCVGQMTCGVARLSNLSTVVRNRTLHGSLAFALGLVLSIGLGFWFGVKYGILGIAISYCIGSASSMIIILIDVLPYVKSCYPKFRLTSFSILIVMSLLMPFSAVFIVWNSLMEILILVPPVLVFYLLASLVLLKNQEFSEAIFKKIKLVGGRFG